MKSSFLGCALIASASVVASASANIWNPDLTTDVGSLLSSANTTDGSGSVDSINGVLAAFFDLDTFTASWDQDIYRIHIADGSAFSAVAYPTPGSNSGRSDFNLSLFDLSGHGVAFNDNSNGSIYPSLTNTFTTGMPEGDYYLAISRNTQGGTAQIQRFNRPILSTGALMFPGQTNNTAAADPSSSLRDGEYSNMSGVFAGWESNGFSFPLNDYYTIDLTGVTFSVPAPGSLALLGLGALGAARRRR